MLGLSDANLVSMASPELVKALTAAGPGANLSVRNPPRRMSIPNLNPLTVLNARKGPNDLARRIRSQALNVQGLSTLKMRPAADAAAALKLLLKRNVTVQHMKLAGAPLLFPRFFSPLSLLLQAESPCYCIIQGCTPPSQVGPRPPSPPRSPPSAQTAPSSWSLSAGRLSRSAPSASTRWSVWTSGDRSPAGRAPALGTRLASRQTTRRCCARRCG